MKAAFGNGRVHDRFICRHQNFSLLLFFLNSFFADVSTWEACTVTQKLDPDLMFERSIRTIKDKNMEQKSLFVEIVGFMRFVWPCLDDSDDIRDLQWRIKSPRNFRPPPWILPTKSRPSSHFCYDHNHISWQQELRLLLLVCECGAEGREYIFSLVTLSLAASCICMGKHPFGLHTFNKSWESKI